MFCVAAHVLFNASGNPFSCVTPPFPSSADRASRRTPSTPVAAVDVDDDDFQAGI